MRIRRDDHLIAIALRRDIVALRRDIVDDGNVGIDQLPGR